MYYSSGNYEAFARPRKPKDVDRKSAYLVGTGLAALTAACYLVRDGQMKGEHVHLFEKGAIPGGACDGYQYPGIGYVMRGGREMDDHFEVMWDLFRSIPSIETEGVSVLDEYYWLNKKDPNVSLCRATEQQGRDAHTDGRFGLSDKGCMEILKLFFTPDEQLYDKRITDVFDAEVLGSNFWLYWRTMFAFENWHSALEMKLYLKRYVHHVGGLPDLRALRFTKYNQYESMILPMIRYLEGYGVRFHYNTKVTNIEFDCADGKKQARTICLLVDDHEERVDLTENDLVFITNGGCVENSSIGAQDQPAALDTVLHPGNGWDLWKKIAAQDPAFGHPEKFCSDPEQTNWMSATVTTLDERIVPYIQNICKRDPFSGGVPEPEIEDLAEHSANTVPVMMPYITAFFMPRAAGDRPAVVPEGAVNFAFLGQFAETPRDTIFTTEYSMRTGMEAVYTLLDIDRGVPEVWGSTYDVRDLLNAAVQLRDGRPLSDLKMRWIERFALGKVIDRVQETDLGRLLQEYKII